MEYCEDLSAAKHHCLLGVTWSSLEWVLVPAVLGAEVFAACVSLLGTFTLEWVLLVLWTAASVVYPPACV